MLILTGTRVQNRHGTRRVRKLPRHLLGEPLFGRTHDYHIEIRRERANRVFAALTLEL